MSDSLITKVFTTTVVEEVVAPTLSPLSDASGAYTQVNVVSTATHVLTSTILVSPESTPAPSSPKPTVTYITSTVISTKTPAASAAATGTPAPSPPVSSSAAAAASGTITAGSTSTSATALPTGARAAAEQSSTAAPAEGKGLPAGAIAGIVIGIVILLNVVGVLLYRRRALAKRRARRATWRAGVKALALPAALDLEKTAGVPIAPAHTSPFMLGMPATKPAGAGHRRSNSDGSPESQYSLPSALTRSPQPAVARDGVAGRARSASPTRRPSGGRAAPERPPRAATRKSPPAEHAALTEPGSAGPRTALATPAAAHVPTAVVRVTFIPTRPDELSIAIGQTLAVLHTFDDGWALCQNAYGEQGMAPLECLEGGGGLFRGFGGGHDARAMVSSNSKTKRRSSLFPPTAQSGRFPRYN